MCAGCSQFGEYSERCLSLNIAPGAAEALTCYGPWRAHAARPAPGLSQHYNTFTSNTRVDSSTHLVSSVLRIISDHCQSQDPAVSIKSWLDWYLILRGVMHNGASGPPQHFSDKYFVSWDCCSNIWMVYGFSPLHKRIACAAISLSTLQSNK